MVKTLAKREEGGTSMTKKHDEGLLLILESHNDYFDTKEKTVENVKGCLKRANLSLHPYDLEYALKLSDVVRNATYSYFLEKNTYDATELIQEVNSREKNIVNNILKQLYSAAEEQA